LELVAWRARHSAQSASDGESRMISLCDDFALRKRTLSRMQALCLRSGDMEPARMIL